MSPNCPCFGWRKKKTKPKINEDKDSPGQSSLISFLTLVLFYSFVHVSVS